jgi:hypothetical protein
MRVGLRVFGYTELHDLPAVGRGKQGVTQSFSG